MFYMEDWNSLLFDLQNVQTPVACPHCGMTYQAYKHKGLLGCSHCYKSFAAYLNKQLAYSQKGLQYIGRKSGEASQNKAKLEEDVRRLAPNSPSSKKGKFIFRSLGKEKPKEQAEKKLHPEENKLAQEIKEIKEVSERGFHLQEERKQVVEKQPSSPQAWYMEGSEEASLVQSTRIRLARNVQGYSFPHHLSDQDAKSLYLHLIDIFLHLNQEFSRSFHVLDMEEIDDILRESLVEKRLISPHFGKHNKTALLLISADEKVSIMLGEEDHLRIQVLMSGLHLQEAYEEAERIALLFEQSFPLAFDQQYGFLTACPSNTGTGLRASVMVHLAFLSRHKIFPYIIRQLQSLGFTVRGDHGEGSQSQGQLYQISNQLTLGITCEESLANLQGILNSLLEKEQELRQKAWEENALLLRDAWGRAYGSLRYASHINTEEALEHISQLRLAMDFGDILPSKENRRILQQMSYQVAPANLQVYAKNRLTAEERDEERANYLRKHVRRLTFSESCPWYSIDRQSRNEDLHQDIHDKKPKKKENDENNSEV